MPDVPSQLATALSDRYAIERPLGEGGMATVYLARDLKHNRRVALKVLKPELAAVVGAALFKLDPSVSGIDMDATGERFLVAKKAQSGGVEAGSLYMVINWAAEVRARLGGKD